MAARVIHFGTDDCQRLHFLRKAGYEVEVCGNILQLRTALRSEADTDAVVMNDSDGSLHENAISVVRSETAAPLVLFASSYRTYNPTDFDLVVSPSASPEEWAIDFALMIVRSRVLREYSQVLRSSSARLRHESEEFAFIPIRKGSGPDESARAMPASQPTTVGIASRTTRQTRVHLPEWNA